MSAPSMPRTVGYFDEYRAGIAADPDRAKIVADVAASRKEARSVLAHPAVQGHVERVTDKVASNVRGALVLHLTERIAHHEQIAAEFGPNSPTSCADADDPAFVEFDPSVHAAAVACAEELRAVRRQIAGDERVIGRAERVQALLG